MKIWTAECLSDALGKRTNICGNSIRFNSKEVLPGDIFIALSIGKSSGAVYVKEAIELGAAGCIVNKGEWVEKSEKVIEVEDTFKALEKLADYKRARSKAKFIAVTGTCGKTTTTKMLFEAISRSFKTFSTYRNFNNFLGVLLNLASMPSETEIAILEMGMSAPGEIDKITTKTLHHIAVITNIGPGHIANFSGQKEIAKAKAEIFNNMQPGGLAVVPSGKFYSNYLKDLAKERRLNAYTFGSTRASDARILSSDGTSIQLEVLGRKVTLDNIPKNNAANAAATILASYLAGVDLKDAARGLSHFKPLEGRGKASKVNFKGAKITIVDRSYNANPLSVRNTLELLSSMKAKRKVLILGDMLELGKNSASYHLALAPLMVKSGADKVIAVGDYVRGLYEKLPNQMQMLHLSSIEYGVDQILSKIEDGDLITVQGSNKMGLCKLVSHLLSSASIEAE